MDVGSAVGRALGIPDAQLLALGDFESSPHFDPVERLTLRLAVAMARTPMDVPADLMAQLRTRFDEAQLVELVACIAWEHYRARFNRAFGIEPSGFSDGAVCVLPER